MTDKKKGPRTLEQIVQEQLSPSWTVVHARVPDTRIAPPRGDARLPDLEALRAKYIGDRGTTAKAPYAVKDAAVPESKTKVVQIQSQGGGRKLNERVGVRRGKIIWKTG